MATVYYSMAGEGRGHAARVQVAVEMLRQRHRVVLYASGQALEMLRPEYRHTEIELRELPGLRFRYSPAGHLSHCGSVAAAVPFVWQMGNHIRDLARRLERDNVDLVISDFEPLLPRAAALAKTRSMTVDYQHFLLACDLTQLPHPLRKKTRLLANLSRPFYRSPCRSVISAFFSPPLLRQSYPVTQVGVLLRKAVLDVTPELGSYLVAYFRRTPPRCIFEALAACRRQVRIYGLGGQSKTGNLTFHPTDTSRFFADLAGCQALVSTAGNQVIGEALYLNKPVLAYPEPGNLEQTLNAFFLEQARTGWARDARGFSPLLIESFLESVPTLRERIRPEQMNGNRATLAAIEYEAQASMTKSWVQSDPVYFPKRKASPAARWQVDRLTFGTDAQLGTNPSRSIG